MNKWDKYFMDVAKRTAELSHCERLKVGAVAAKNRRIILCGFNGMPAGADNCCEETVDGQTVTRQDVSHAERNLIEFAAAEGIPLRGCDLYTTHLSCLECAKSIVNAGIQTVFYEHEYRDPRGRFYLLDHGIEVINIRL